MNDEAHSVQQGRLCLVTGATGLLGNNVVRQLLADGHRVRALVRSAEKARRVLGGLDVELVVGDMERIPAFAHALDGCDTVFHTAAYFREYYQPGEHAEKLESINVRGTLALMAEADRRGVRTFVHTSSSGAIGTKPDGSPGDEDTLPTPDLLANGYFKSKVDGDARIRSFERSNGMRVIEIYPGWMWGPGDAAPTAAGQLVLDFVAKKVPVVPDGGACVVDARDVARAMLTSAERAPHGARFIVAGEFRELAAALTELERVTTVRGPRFGAPHAFVMVFAWFQELRAKWMGGPLLVSREAVRLMHARHIVSSERARRELDATFRPFAETVRDVVAWYVAQGMLRPPPAPGCSQVSSTSAPERVFEAGESG